jgi:lipopolysaccharide biosynthesis glycosyltransferase
MSEVLQSNPLRRAVVTLAIGSEAQGWLARSGPRFSAYAAQFGYDFIAIVERKINYRLQWHKSRVNLHLEKFQIGPMLDDYDRVIYFDADILLFSECPDLGAIVPPEALGVVADPSGIESWKRDEEMANMEKNFGKLANGAGPYFNAGVLVFSKAHRELLRFDPKKFCPGRWPDQTYLNYASAQLGLPRAYLDSRANFLPGNDGWNDSAKRKAAWAAHYAGPDAKRAFFGDAAG